MPKSRQNLASHIALFILLFASSLVIVYLGARPEQYSLEENQISAYDIEAPRSVVNRIATEARALEAKSQVANIFTRSEEVTAEVLESSQVFWRDLQSSRKDWQLIGADYSDTEERKDKQNIFLEENSDSLNKEYNLELSKYDLSNILQMSEARFAVFGNKLLTACEAIMANPVDETELPYRIISYFSDLNYREQKYVQDTALVRRIVKSLLKPNVIYNEAATLNAMDSAYERVKQNPIMVNRGSRIVSSGELIDEEIYTILEDSNLLQANQLDVYTLAGQGLLLLIVWTLLFLYFTHYEKEILGFNSETFGLAVAIFIPLIISAYLGRDYQLAPPVYFTAILLSSYFSFRSSMLTTIALTVMCLPLVNFNPAFILVGICGGVLAAYLSSDDLMQAKFTRLVFWLSFCNLATSLGFSLTQGQTFAGAAPDLSAVLISTILSIVAAVGLIPLFEILFKSVPPARLIALSQPGQPLLKRLFIEAPGTSQHSLMVGNLADAGAESIGADALICRVGAYYHDIGKLRNPLYFTENQSDYNPHDDLSPEQSAKIIIRHTQDGYEMAEEAKLPQVILNIITEHHGTTLLSYFYSKAKNMAEEEGLDPPDEEIFRYKGPLPSSPESAVVMLADSTEAAVKSLKTKDMNQVVEMINKVFRIKLDQDQFNESGLGFADIDKIREAFIRVYSGHFHERIEYPKDEDERAIKLG